MASRTGLVIILGAFIVAAWLNPRAESHAASPIVEAWNQVADRVGCARALDGDLLDVATARLFTCVVDRLDRLEARVQALERKANRK